MKILLVTQHIFPIQTPRSFRSTELIKEFARRGFEVDVYAVLGRYDYSTFLKEFPTVHLHNLPLKWQFKPYTSDGNATGHLFDRIANKLFSKILEFPTIEFLYRIPKVLKKKDYSNYDLLVSVAVPHQIHWGCQRFKKQFSQLFPKKWIADCGDPFMNNDNTTFHYSYFKKFEHLFCQACDYITVPHEKAQFGYYEEYRAKIRIIPQGFHFDMNESKEPQNAILKIGYAGMFIKQIRDPKLFFEYLLTIDKDFELHVYTPYLDLIKPYIKSFEKKLILHKPLPRKDLIKELATMDFLVNIENKNLPTALPSKLIDYSIVNRPILSIHPKQIDYSKIDEFFEKDYSQAFKVDNIMDYHISNVVDKFLDL